MSTSIANRISVGAEQALAKATDKSSSFTDYLARSRAADVSGGDVGMLAGLAAGAIVGNKYGGHYVLGGIGGASLGRNLPAMLRPGERRYAICNMAQTGSGIAGALVFPKHPVIGFLIGSIASGIAIHYGGYRK